MNPARPSRRALLATLPVLAAAGCASAVEEARRQGTGRSGGTLVLGSVADLAPATLLSQGTTSMTIGRLVHDTLVRYDLRTGEPRPAVATSWDVSHDGLTVVLELRDDVTWHTGRPFTSADVAHALRVHAAEENASQLRPAAAAVTSVDVSRPHTAVLHLAQPLVNLFDLLEFVLLVDSETEAERVDGRFVGTGPFTLDGWRRGRSASLRRNDSYWGGPSALEAVEVRVVTNQTSLLTGVRSGDLDLVVDADVQALAPFRDDERYDVTTMDVWDVNYYVGVNVTDPALADVRLRQVVALAVDRERILAEVFAGTGSVNSSPWSVDSPAYDEAAAARWGSDPARARALLAELGGPPSTVFELAYSSGLAPARAVAEIVQNGLAAVGVRVELRPYDGPALSRRLGSGEHQLWVNPHGFGQNNPATLATGAAPFRPGGNLSRYSSPDYARAVAEVWNQPDPDSSEARSAYAEFTRILGDELFVVNLVTTTATNVSTANVEGVSWNTYKDLVLDRATVR